MYSVLEFFASVIQVIERINELCCIVLFRCNKNNPSEGRNAFGHYIINKKQNIINYSFAKVQRLFVYLKRIRDQESIFGRCKFDNSRFI